MDLSSGGSHHLTKVRKNIISRVKGERHLHSAHESEDVTDDDTEESSRDSKKVSLKTFKCIRSIFSPFGADSDLLVVSYVSYTCIRAEMRTTLH